MRVDVYFNIHKKLFSIRSREPETRGLVIAHSRSVTLLNPRAVVSEKGRQRVLKEQRKNVHAVIRGIWNPDAEPFTAGLQWYYNPYTIHTFAVLKKAPVKGERIRFGDYEPVNDFQWHGVTLNAPEGGRPSVVGRPVTCSL